MRIKSLLLPGALLIGAMPAIASAHPGHGDAGLIGGIMHPLSGVDHILAMVAVGLWAAQLGGRAIWQLPAAFMAFMVIGGALGATHTANLPVVEAGVLASVLALGLLVATGARLPISGGLVLVGLFALCHGYAHGQEVAPGSAALPYGVGIVLSSLMLQGIGVGTATAMLRAPGRGAWVRTCGAAVVVAGAALAIGAIAW